jgi:hypothetical protein
MRAGAAYGVDRGFHNYSFLLKVDAGGMRAAQVERAVFK